MQHAWKAYEQYAFGADELLPKSLGANNNWGGMGNTLIDSLDTLWLMNMTEEFDRARNDHSFLGWIVGGL
jgi:mannosyl-oligosaccharide alpha-1,2-mannosidase